MTSEQTIEKLYDLKLGAMAEAFRETLSRSAETQLSFAERFGLLVDREWTRREENRLTRRLKTARLRVPASVEEVDFQTPRGLDRDVFLELAAGRYLKEHHNIIISGGQDALKGKIFRIGHLGAARISDLLRTWEAVGRELNEMGIGCDVEAVLTEAEDVYRGL